MNSNEIKRKKIINNFRKAISIAAICFSMSILFIGIYSSIVGSWIEPGSLVKIWIAFFMIGINVFFRIMIDETKWALDKPCILKNIIFMPINLIIALILAMNLAKVEGFIPSFSLLLVYAGIFLIVFTFTQIIQYLIDKAGTDKMNDALQEFKKEHSWDEEE
ncbi:MAG: hypothetical protein K6E10_02835 [Eubacterium sp.]|nr:hypothetical protein [Eubacterium sp.]